MLLTATDQDYVDSFDEITRLMITSHPNAHFWIGGDFNLPDVSWTSNSVPPGAKDSYICKAAVQLAQYTALIQVVDQPTRGNNILDLLLTNRPSLVNRLASLPPLSAKADQSMPETWQWPATRIYSWIFIIYHIYKRFL